MLISGYFQENRSCKLHLKSVYANTKQVQRQNNSKIVPKLTSFTTGDGHQFLLLLGKKQILIHTVYLHTLYSIKPDVVICKKHKTKQGLSNVCLTVT